MLKKENLLKWWNFWPPFLFSGIRIEEISKNFQYARVRLKLRFYNANYVGTQFGGSLFAMTDPFYMIMLIKNLGSDYIVWDKSACIAYLKPGRTDVLAEFSLSNEEIEEIKNIVAEKQKMDWQKTIEVKDLEGSLIAKVQKVIYIRRRTPLSANKD